MGYILYTRGNNMSITFEQTLSDILNVSELIYRNMSSPDGADHADIFNLLTTLGKVLVDADRASFWKWDKASHTLWTTAATGTSTITIPDTTGLVGKALADNRLPLLEQQIGEGNLNAAFETAHALKGMYANLSLTPLTKPVSEITELLRSRTKTDYAPLLAGARAQFEALCSL